MSTVKRPFMRHPPCVVECRCDGDKVYALVGKDYVGGAVGFGDTLADALRNLADALEAEVAPSVAKCEHHLVRVGYPSNWTCLACPATGGRFTDLRWLAEEVDWERANPPRVAPPKCGKPAVFKQLMTHRARLRLLAERSAPSGSAPSMAERLVCAEHEDRVSKDWVTMPIDGAFPKGAKCEFVEEEENDH